MKVLVTGASGQLGKALLAGAPAGWDCTGLTRTELDLAHPERALELVRAARPDVLVNAAAYTAVERAEDQPGTAFAVNGHAVGVLAEAMRGVGGRLVQVSTDFVFEGASPRAYRPHDARNPLSVYGRSKALGEDLAGSNALIVRTAWLYGESKANFVGTMLRLMRERGEVRVVADQVGAPTWAPRLAEVIWRLVDARASGVFHYSDAGVASWYDFAVAIAEEAQAVGLLPRPVTVLPVGFEDYPTRAERPHFSLLESTATLAATGLEPVHWRKNLRRALADVLALSQAGKTPL